jgi:hypothetical protein
VDPQFFFFFYILMSQGQPALVSHLPKMQYRNLIRFFRFTWWKYKTEYILSSHSTNNKTTTVLHDLHTTEQYILGHYLFQIDLVFKLNCFAQPILIILRDYVYSTSIKVFSRMKRKEFMITLPPDQFAMSPTYLILRSSYR